MKKLLITLALSALLMLALTGIAVALDGNTIPHGGYSATTDVCLQCHDVHEAQGDYALMYQNTVVNTCGTCHGVYQQAPSGARDPGYPGIEAGTAALKSVYKVPLADKYTHEGHRLGQGGTAGPYTYKSGPNGVQPYTTSTPDYIPGSQDYSIPGNFGTLLTRLPGWAAWLANGQTEVDAVNYPASGKSALQGLYCVSCHSPHGNYGRALPAGVTNGKLLSDRPNHTTNTVDASSWTSWVNWGDQWCIRCHKARDSANYVNNGGKPYNHPISTGSGPTRVGLCLQCHGNNASDPLAPQDFPHSGATNLLSDYPDALCIRCHVSGTLP